MTAQFITGREIIMGAAKGATWRTAVSLGANDGILILSEGLGAKAPTRVLDESLGQDHPMYSIKTHEMQNGSLEGYLRYEGWDVLLALVLGTAGTPTQLESTAYYNTYSPAANISDYFATLAIKKSATTKSIWEVPSAKITGFTISGEIGDLAKVTFNTMGNKIENENPVNTSLTNVTYPTRTNIVKMDAMTKFRMNTQSGGALADTDKIYPSKFEITYNRPFKENFEASYSDMSEPTQDGFAEAKIKLTFDKYNLDTFMSAIENDTDYKMDMTFEGGVITGSVRYQMRFDFPKITWTSGTADVGGPGTFPHEVEGDLLQVASAPTGMSGVTDPLSIYVINTRTTDPLA